MKFIDEAVISVQSGDGGAGCLSFRRERFVPRGGPDGGDGGKGGDVILKTSSGKHTLYDFRFRRNFKAKKGGRGQGSRRTGKSGENFVIDIPPGTIVTDLDTGEILRDCLLPGEEWVVAEGGRGGKGNRHFTSSTHRTPRFSQPGEPGKTLNLKLELKLIADVGIIGLPNAGKSTLIQAVSSAKPKIADYPFTTLTPTLGVVYTGWGEPFVMADIPGLIEGAHQGAGLGDRFLRHIERTRILVHLIDANDIDPEDPLASYRTVNNELMSFSGKIAEKPQIVVLNKTDLPGTEEGVARFRQSAEEIKILTLSAITGAGADKLKSEIVRMLGKIDDEY